ncbi:hypothetical protein PENTCL1PPCAC_1456, partial [Pristionchus entomophagus]
ELELHDFDCAFHAAEREEAALKSSTRKIVNDTHKNITAEATEDTEIGFIPSDPIDSKKVADMKDEETAKDTVTETPEEEMEEEEESETDSWEDAAVEHDEVAAAATSPIPVARSIEVMQQRVDSESEEAWDEMEEEEDDDEDEEENETSTAHENSWEALVAAEEANINAHIPIAPSNDEMEQDQVECNAELNDEEEEETESETENEEDEDEEETESDCESWDEETEEEDATQESEEDDIEEEKEEEKEVKSE